MDTEDSMLERLGAAGRLAEDDRRRQQPFASLARLQRRRGSTPPGGRGRSEVEPGGHATSRPVAGGPELPGKPVTGGDELARGSR